MQAEVLAAGRSYIVSELQKNPVRRLTGCFLKSILTFEKNVLINSSTAPGVSLANCFSPHGHETGGFETAGGVSEKVIIQPHE